MREIIARPRDVQPLKRLIPGIIAGIIALVVLVGGVWSNLVADELKGILKGPYYPLVVWGVFASAVAVAAGSAIWAVWRPKDDGSDLTATSGEHIEQQRTTYETVHREVYEAVHPGGSPIIPANTLHQLTPPPADFTGRTEELGELMHQLGQGGVAISGLRGMGGIGKTALARRLAQELAPRYPDAQIELDLKGLDPQPLTAAQVMAHVIHAYHPEARLPESEAELAGMYRSVLNGQRALLLLDNAASAQQVQPLIPPQGCLLLVTSRRVFHLPGLYALDLDTLSREEAREFLFTIEPRIGDEADEIAQLCGYLPLALRVAASTLKERPDLSPAEYRRRLEDARQRFPEVDASFSLSYDLLAPELQQRWRALAVFPGTFARPAAAAVWELAPDPAQDNLGALLTYSLVEWGADTQRYRLHDLARQYADARLAEEERAAARWRHAEHFRDVLGYTDQLYLEGGDKLMQGLALFDLEWGNIQAGQAWAAVHGEGDNAVAGLCSAYPDAGAYVLDLRLHPQEKIRWLEAALAAARRLGDRSVEGRHLNNLGIVYRWLGEARRAIEHHEQALAIHRELDDRLGEGNAAVNLGSAYLDLWEPRRAIGYYEQALAIHRETGDRRGEGNALVGLGIACRRLGEAQRAIGYYEQALAINRELGDRRGEGNNLVNLGTANADLGEVRRAIECHEQALAIHRELGDRWGEGQNLGSLGNAYRQLWHARRAIGYYEQALAIHRETGDRRGEGQDLWNISVALEGLEERAEAITQAEAALQIFEDIEDPNAARVREVLEQWRAGRGAGGGRGGLFRRLGRVLPRRR